MRIARHLIMASAFFWAVNCVPKSDDRKQDPPADETADNTYEAETGNSPEPGSNITPNPGEHPLQPFLGAGAWQHSRLPGVPKAALEFEIYTYNSMQPVVFTGGTLPCGTGFGETTANVNSLGIVSYDGTSADPACLTDFVTGVQTAGTRLQVEVACFGPELAAVGTAAMAEMTSLRERCQLGFTMRYNFQSDFSASSTEEGSGANITANGDVRIVLQQRDGAACRWRRGSGGVFLQDSPCQFLRYLNYRQYTYNGRVIESPSRRLLLTAQNLQGKLTDKYFSQGNMAVYFNDWAGEINFARANPDPAMTLRTSSEVFTSVYAR